MGESLERLENQTAIFVPTRNGGASIKRYLRSLRRSIFQPKVRLAIDTESEDDTTAQLKNAGFDVHKIKKSIFTHGLVRHQAVDLLDPTIRYLVMTTQDIEFDPDAIGKLVSFVDRHSDMGVAYGRQMIRRNIQKNYLEYVDKLRQYPDTDSIKSLNSIPELGIKTVFSSDVFCVYRVSDLKAIGNFNRHLTFSEDMYAAATMIMENYTVGYVAEAKVEHCNELKIGTIIERYREIGTFHRQYPWIQEKFGKNEKAGIHQVLQELGSDLRRLHLARAVEITIKSICKYIAYKLPLSKEVVEASFHENSRE